MRRSRESTAANCWEAVGFLEAEIDDLVARGVIAVEPAEEE